jgi:hypothetical protein
VTRKQTGGICRSADRWVVQYNLYVNDQRWGRVFVGMCPYLPFSARVCLNQHHWLANRLREEGIDFQQCSNAFLRCAAPKRLQELADALTPHDLSSCGHKWLARFHTLLHGDRALSGRLPAPAVLLTSRIVQQPDLSSAGDTRQIG